ncbi:MAG TPA: type IV secretory system conjugative DNA transfer family protein, partial [Clostridiales bacterium]|nr:type IV secretory system conjugative DNA transfer family protein [Clostridiales bacterium]
MDLSLDDEDKADFDKLASSLETTLMNTDLVLGQVKAGGKALQFPVFTAFGLSLYVMMKITGKKKFHRKGEEHGSARWANKKEVIGLRDKPPKAKKGEKKSRDKPKKDVFVEDKNIILTNDVKMSLDTRQTRKNLNVMVIGGSGSGKSRFYVKPNLMQSNTSYVCTDPKGELLRSTGKMLEQYGYKIKVFNLIDMGHSNNYNPFNYIYDVDGNYSATAVIKMINVLMKNTSKEGGGGGDQFWDDSTKALLGALCFYLVECESKEMQNFSEVMKLLKKAEVKEASDEFQSDLDLIFDALENPQKYVKEGVEETDKMKELGLIDLAKKDKKPSEYMCLKYYKDFKKAAGDTAKSILISTAVRLQAFNIPEVMDLTCCDNINLEMIGDEKTAMFIIIPSSDDTFNFLAAMMYTQLFDVLYDRANFKHGGRLPIHVRCLLDEFANLGQIPRFEELLATMRSMEISANVIIQNLSQLKKMYKDSWENVLGNCDSLLFLGGQEPTTLEHVSKMLGKETIDTRSRNRTRGRQGSTSENDAILGRDLMTVDELKTMKDNECILFVRGISPFFCDKFVIEKHLNYKLLEDSNKDNAYLLSGVNTVKFYSEDEQDNEDLH